MTESGRAACASGSGKRAALNRWIDRNDIGIFGWGYMRQMNRVADDNRPGNRPAPEKACRGAWSTFRCASAGPAAAWLFQRCTGQYKARWLCQTTLEDTCNAAALFRIFQLGIRRIDICRQIAFLDDPFGRVLIGGRETISSSTPSDIGDTGEEFARIVRFDIRLAVFRRRSRSGLTQIGLPSLRQ